MPVRLNSGPIITSKQEIPFLVAYAGSAVEGDVSSYGVTASCADVGFSEGVEMMLSVSAAAVILTVAWICPSHALYFHIGETEKKCFIEEIPDETMVIGELAAG